MQSIKLKHLFFFKVHVGGERETDCLAKIALAKASDSTQRIFFFKIGFDKGKLDMEPY